MFLSRNGTILQHRHQWMIQMVNGGRISRSNFHHRRIVLQQQHHFTSTRSVEVTPTKTAGNQTKTATNFSIPRQPDIQAYTSQQLQRQRTKNHHPWLTLTTSAVIFVLVGGTTGGVMVECEPETEKSVITTKKELSAGIEEEQKQQQHQQHNKRRLLYSHHYGGVKEEDVDALVSDILNDPTINISMVPDSIERLLYKSTIQLTLNFIYHLLSQVDGITLLAHEIQLLRRHGGSNNYGDNNINTTTTTTTTTSINDLILEQVADRLLQNQMINSSFIPDVLERKIYINCLKVFFRVLTAITNSIRITLCGHELRLLLQPQSIETILLTAAETAATTAATTTSNSTSQQQQQQLLLHPINEGSSHQLSQIDLDKLRDFAVQSGIDNDDYYNNLSWWDQLFMKHNFVTQLHVSLYGLMLGIVDDFLANTQINILSDQFTLDIVPATTTTMTASSSSGGGKQQQQETTTDTGNDSVGSFAAASFAAGIGIGMAVMALATNSR